MKYSLRFLNRALAHSNVLFTFAVFGLFAFVSQVSGTELGKTQHLVNLETVPDGLNASDWTSIRAAYETQRHAAFPNKDGYSARNWGQQWQTQFDGRGFLTQPDAGGWQWGLELRSYGFGGNERVIRSKPEIKSEGQRVIYRWDMALEEWFVNDQRGLEHGFTVQERPAGRSADARLEFDLAVRGDLQPRISADGSAITFVNSSGGAVVTYSTLKVWDADGKVLPARFDAINHQLSTIKLSVDDRGARYPITIDPIAQQAYLKASNTEARDFFGFSVAISGDTVVVGAYEEASNATGVNGNQSDNSAEGAGAAYVFTRSGGLWTQQAYLKASNTEAFDVFGHSVAISGDTVVVGARNEASNATGVNGNESDNSAGTAGAVYVFTRSGGVWTQQAYLKASNTDAGDWFGHSVAISGDTVVVGARNEASIATGVNGNQSDNSANGAGAVYVFTRSGGLWTQQAYLKASNNGEVTKDQGDNFGDSVAISADTVVVGAHQEDSNATGVNGNQSDNSAIAAGAAYVFTRSGGVWTQQAYLKASNTGVNDEFGLSVAISGDTVVVGAYLEDSNATGVNGNQSDNSASDAGAAYVFMRSGGIWTQQAYLKASNTEAGDHVGSSVAISGDTVVVGAWGEASNATGVNGNQSDNSANIAGAAYVFTRSGGVWTQQAYLKASNTDLGDFFGISVAISADTVVVGAYQEDSTATGVNGDQSDNGAQQAGAAYVFAFPSAKMANLSTRGFVGTDDNVLIGGIIVQGDTSMRILFRAKGPSLTALGVVGALANPQLDLHDSNGALIAHNDNWKEEPDGTPNAARQAQINATGLAPTNDLESAILALVSPGNYTAIISGVGASPTGIALVEAYTVALPP